MRLSFYVIPLISSAAAFNNPPGVDIWCGKAYRPENASFNPGGWLEAPALSPEPLLDLRVRPRMSFYVSGEGQGSFIVDTAISNTLGQPYPNTPPQPYSTNASSRPTLVLTIFEVSSNLSLVANTRVPLNTTGNELKFTLSGLTAQVQPYDIKLAATSPDNNQTYEASTQLSFLPSPSPGGSTVKIDSLTSGILVPSSGDTLTWAPFFPYSYYVQYDGYLNSTSLLSNLDVFASQGYNMIHIVPDGDPSGFDFSFFSQLLDHCDQIGLRVMYDMRWTYTNLSSVAYQVDQLKGHSSLLLYYTGDEPDGNGDPLNATALAYQQIKSQDPYHPVSLCLNCYNFYYQEYTSGADIILEDVYPVSNNVTFSSEYGTPCNDTYGCCGCDDCHRDTEFGAITARQDLLAEYQRWIGGPPKPRWGVPQAFGASQFWTRIPDADEEAVMVLLRVNHGARGMVAWTWPTTNELANATSKLAGTLTNGGVVGFTLGENGGPVSLDVQGGNGMVDAAAWEGDGKMLVSIVSTDYDAIEGQVTVSLPTQVSTVGDSCWGSGGWVAQGGSLAKQGLQGLEADMFVVS